MPPYLHPRSRSTSTLFTGCLAVSFLVVGAPHLLPCPVDRRQFTENGEVIQKRRKRAPAPKHEESPKANLDPQPDVPMRECPVPKPRGILGQMLGFREEARGEGMEVVVKPLSQRRPQQDKQEET
ncbi:hypothetical protein CAC42_4453 [Sphaceloma murrayae]|uniref:Uncharacterized protein n=1 Tax=Sphaceloma murrayae TaxID=2082308 RepID=A0A2K1QM87_9PEZI|nr:hypothetical protein CAC42_4453 [Sphaceloma murrayae]